MSRARVALLAPLFFVLAAPAAAALPERGVLVPGRSLAGVEVGMTKAQVTKAWGARHGICRDCRRPTWYFNSRPFQPEGAGVIFERERVAYVFTVWRPGGWRTTRGLRLGAPAAQIARMYGPLDRRECGRGMPRPFYALIFRSGLRAQTVFYVFRDRLWGFALTVPDASPCL